MKLERLIIAGIAALVVVSGSVIGCSYVARFPTFSATEAVVQLGVGFTACTLWILAVVGILGAVVKGRLSRRWLLCALVALAAFFVVMPWPFRYAAAIDIATSQR